MSQENTSIPDIHIGNLILEYLKGNEISQAKLARDLKVDSAYLNRLLKKKSFETDRLFDICMALEHNFFAVFCNDTDHTDENYTIGLPDLGLHIERQMKTVKMTQTDFAAQLGVSQSDISKILRKSSFDTDKLAIISRILNYNFFHEFYGEIPASDEEATLQHQTYLLKRFEELTIENERLRNEVETLKRENEELKKKKTSKSPR